MPCPMCRRRGKPPHFGSDPRCAFENRHQFSSDNWNCATANAIRDLFPSEWDDAETLPHSFRRRHDDECEAAISVAGVDLETRRAKTLWVGWYKERGQTDEMWLLGYDEPSVPSLADCEAIIAHFAAEHAALV